jgi:hypothetical protein
MALMDRMVEGQEERKRKQLVIDITSRINCGGSV